MTEPLWTSDAAVVATGGALVGAGWTAHGVSIDTRSLEPGDLFIALEGPNNDGHNFLDAAFEAGAAAALVHKDYGGEGPVLRVDDTLRGLEALAGAARERCAGRRLAVTGSAGKTGTKELMRLAFEGEGETHASVASFNNHWGVPLTLARMPAHTDYGLFELGMNHAGEIRTLSGFVRPQAAIITTIAAAHLEFFDGLDAIARAKAEIFEPMAAGGLAVIHADLDQTRILIDVAEDHGLTVRCFGRSDTADCKLVSYVPTAEGAMVQADVFGRVFTYRLAVAGEHWALNSLAVLTLVAGLGLDPVAAAGRLANLRPPKGRGERSLLALRSGDVLLIDESYNANPESMVAALKVLSAAPVGPEGRRIAVLGDMLELGEEAESLHAGLVDAIEREGADEVWLCGPMMQALWSVLPDRLRGEWHPAAADLGPRLAPTLRPGDAVMVKGSNGSRTFDIVSYLQNAGPNLQDTGPDTGPDTGKGAAGAGAGSGGSA
ncbi:MAG: UDP-N-acetylmuramoyl-tripeptide--D-alanyl-D-alanine ligase [Pseudomonadota bacterium]